MATGELTEALRETLAIFDADPTGQPLTTKEVADDLDMGRRSTYDRLDRLVEQGHLETKAVGARGRVWWVPRDEPDGTGEDETPNPDGPGDDSNLDAAAQDPSSEGPDHPNADGPGEDSNTEGPGQNSTTGGTGEDPTGESFRALVDAVEEYAIFRLDAAGRIVTWNAGAARIKGYERSEIVGESLTTFYTDADAERRVPEQNLAAAAREGWVEDEGWRVRKDGSRFWASVTITALYDEDGDLEGYVKVTRDMTERRTYEQRLRRQRDELESELDEVFERVDDAFLAVDDEWRVTYANDGAAALVERTVGELLGSTIWTILPAIGDERPRERIEEAVSRGESAEFDVHAESLGRWIEVRAYPSDTGVSLYVRDVSERKQRERELERYETIVETVDDGIYIAEDGRFTMVNDQYAEMTGYDREELVGADVSLVVSEETASAAAAYEDELRAGERETARVEADVQRADGSEFRAEATFTLLPASSGDVARVGVVRDVSERVERERELRRRQERLAALDDLNAVVREITNDAIEQSTRDEIERTLCERLAATDSYEFAWIGWIDAPTKTVRQRVGAGADDAFDGLRVPLDRSPTQDGPIARAIETLEMQVSSGLADDPAYDERIDRVGAAADQPWAAIPIVHEELCYGVLSLAAAREDAFAKEEREVVAQLGTVVGHAIAALERKRALMSDEVVELEFRLADVVETFGIDVGPGGKVSLDRAVPVGGDRFLLYGTADPAGVDLLRSMVDAIPSWEDVDVFEDRGDVRRLTVSLTEAPVLSTVASRGGSMEEFVVEDDEIYMRIHLGPDAGVREIIDLIQKRHPAAEMVARRQIDRQVEGESADLSQTATERLTERQRVALEAAYNGGFFEQPRLHSGEEIAETLDVTAATFHQHLRKAEATLIEAALEGPER